MLLANKKIKDITITNVRGLLILKSALDLKKNTSSHYMTVLYTVN